MLGFNTLLSLISLGTQVVVEPWRSFKGPRPDQIKNLVTFGDSYTDTDALGPGIGGDGGVAWPAYASGYGSFDLYPFALSGSTCSHHLTNFSVYPSLFEHQVPRYMSALSNQTLRLDPARTLYTLWIGTNDVGSNMLLTGAQAPGVTIVDTVRCAVNWVEVLYAAGARNFLFQNMVPLQHAPLYAPDSYTTPLWTAPRNTSEWHVFMTELVVAGNALSRLMLKELAPTLPGAHLGVFDSYALFTDIRESPAKYLNGTAPLNVTGCSHACVAQPGADQDAPADCQTATDAERDSYMWFNELHPSEQVNRVVAREVTKAIKRQSERYTTWLA